MSRVKFIALVCLGLALVGCGKLANEGHKEKQNSSDGESNSNRTYQNQLVEASCGQCEFGLSGDGCDLAVRIDGKAYFVDGSSIDEHGDAHAKDGLCNCIRNATVSGTIQDGRFQASHFDVLKQGSAQKEDDKK